MNIPALTSASNASEAGPSRSRVHTPIGLTAVCRSSVFTQEPVQRAAHAHRAAAERSHPQKVLGGQASPAQHARTTKEPNRGRELYPSYRVLEPGLSDIVMLLYICPTLLVHNTTALLSI